MWCVRRVIRHHVRAPRRLLSSQTQPNTDVLSKVTRNIGIIAHIDAVGCFYLQDRFTIDPRLGENYHDGTHALL